VQPVFFFLCQVNAIPPIVLGLIRIPAPKIPIEKAEPYFGGAVGLIFKKHSSLFSGEKRK